MAASSNDRHACHDGPDKAPPSSSESSSALLKVTRDFISNVLVSPALTVGWWQPRGWFMRCPSIASRSGRSAAGEGLVPSPANARSVPGLLLAWPQHPHDRLLDSNLASPLSVHPPRLVRPGALCGGLHNGAGPPGIYSFVGGLAGVAQGVSLLPYSCASFIRPPSSLLRELRR
jgi:hypothetical protein